MADNVWNFHAFFILFQWFLSSLMFYPRLLYINGKVLKNGIRNDKELKAGMHSYQKKWTFIVKVSSWKMSRKAASKILKLHQFTYFYTSNKHAKFQNYSLIVCIDMRKMLNFHVRKMRFCHKWLYYLWISQKILLHQTGNVISFPKIYNTSYQRFFIKELFPK
jgi:hypothetical protein